MRTLTQTPNAHPLFPERKGKALRLEGNYQIPAPPPHSPRDKGSGQKPGRMRAFQPLLMASAALVLSSGAVFANCGGALGINILASGGSTCFANGQYISTTLVAGEATGAGSVLTNNTGAGLNSVLFSTSTQAAAVWADTGGTVTLTASPLATVTLNTSGAGAAGLYATGARSTITATGIANTSSGGPTTSSGFQSSAVDAETSASITLNGGSIFKNGNSGLGIFATSGGSVNATGTTITADGNGVQALFVTNGGSLVGSGLTINSYGTTDPVTGLNASIGSNGYGSTPNGGTLQLSNSTFATTGDYNFGIATSNNGVTTLTNNQITVSGANAQAINTSTGGPDHNQRRLHLEYWSGRHRRLRRIGQSGDDKRRVNNGVRPRFVGFLRIGQRHKDHGFKRAAVNDRRRRYRDWLLSHGRSRSGATIAISADQSDSRFDGLWRLPANGGESPLTTTHHLSLPAPDPTCRLPPGQRDQRRLRFEFGSCSNDLYATGSGVEDHRQRRRPSVAPPAARMRTPSTPTAARSINVTGGSASTSAIFVLRRTA